MTTRISFIILLAMAHVAVWAQSDRSNELFARGVELYQQGKYAEAVPLFEQVQALDNEELGETSARRGYGESWLAACYYKMGNTAKANEVQPFAYMVTPIDRRLTVESDRLSDQGVFFYTSGNYEKALEYFQRCAALELKTIGRHCFYANSLKMCAECLMYVSRMDEAKPLLMDALAIYQQAHCDYACYFAKDMLGLCYRYLNQADSACYYLEQALQGYQSVGDEQGAANIGLPLKTCRAIVAYVEGKPETKSLFGEVKAAMEQEGTTSGYDYDQVLYYLLGCAYFMEGDATYAYQEGMRLRQRFEQDQLTLVAEYLDVLHITVLAGLQSQQMKLEDAIAQEELIIKIAKENMGTDNEYYVRSLQYLANLNSNVNPELSRRQAQEAYDIVERSDQQLTPQTAALVYQLMAQNYANDMKLDEASAMFDKAYNVYQTYEIPITGDYTYLLGGIVGLYSNIDRLDDAAAAGEQFIKIYKLYNWPADYTYITTTVSLQSVYEALGNTKRLRELINETRLIYQNNPALPKLNLSYSRFLQLEANLAIADGNYTQAMADAEELRALAATTEQIDADFRTMADMCGQYLQVQCYIAQGNTERAMELVQDMRAIEFKGETFGQSKQYADAISLAVNSIIAMAQGDYTSAIAQMQQALRQYDAVGMGDNNPMRLNLLNGLTSYAWQAGDLSTLMQGVTEQNTFMRSFVRSHFQTMTYQERCDFWAKYNGWFNVQLPNAAYRLPTDTMRCEVYNGLLLSKGLLLNSEIELKRLIDESGDAEAQQLYAQFVQHKVQLAGQQAESLTSQQRDSLSQVMYQEEKDVMLMLNEKFGDYTRRLDVAWSDVRQHLKAGEAAIEFVLSPLSPDSLVYSALVLKPGYESPHLVPLFLEPQLTSIAADQLYTTTAASQLVWAPLADELSGVRRVYFSPVGQLYSTGIEYLPMTDDLRTAGEQYELLRVSSTREVALAHRAPAQPSVTLFGGIEYGAESDAIAKQNLAMALTPSDYRPRSATDRFAVQAGVSPLPGTRREVEQILALLRRHHISARPYVEEQASEECFKAQGQARPTWLHIATHGFFWNEEQAHEYQDLAFMQQSLLLEMMGEQSVVAQEDRSLTRTGLLFAGADNTLQGADIPSNMDDGILTAQEISRLDLRTVDLVVLSACETATGDINSDGVFGLQRGFKKAGVQTIVMSLWKVDDDATQLLMTEFYRNIVERHQTKRTAFAAAQQHLRTTQGGKYADPRYWAAFIMLDGTE